MFPIIAQLSLTCTPILPHSFSGEYCSRGIASQRNPLRTDLYVVNPYRNVIHQTIPLNHSKSGSSDFRSGSSLCSIAGRYLPPDRTSINQGNHRSSHEAQCYTHSLVAVINHHHRRRQANHYCIGNV